MVNRLLGVREKKDGCRKMHSEGREDMVEAYKIEEGNGCVGEWKKEKRPWDCQVALKGSIEAIK